MSTQAVTSGASVNNGGTVKKAGNVDTTGPITTSRTLMDDAVVTPYGAKVSEAVSPSSSGNIGTFSAMTNFAYEMQAGRYIMKKHSQYVNGIANDILESCGGASKHARAIPKLETTRALGSGHLTTWDYETGAISKGANAGSEVDFGNDHAARPTNAVPGELAYKTGAKLPIEDEYKPRTST